MISYSQTIDNYPNGGGAFIVAKDNLGVLAGIIAGAALSVDYILTVAVSISSGVDQIVTAISVLRPYKLEICLLLVLLLMIGNLRGIRESSRIFGIPAYAFMLAIVSLIIAGFFKLKTGYIPPEPKINYPIHPVTMILLLKAFGSGCTALTDRKSVV